MNYGKELEEMRRKLREWFVAHPREMEKELSIAMCVSHPRIPIEEAHVYAKTAYAWARADLPHCISFNRHFLTPTGFQVTVHVIWGYWSGQNNDLACTKLLGEMFIDGSVRLGAIGRGTVRDLAGGEFDRLGGLSDPTGKVP